jgi:hypothetical protein
MENLNNAVKYIVENELLKAKEIIHASLYEKMGKILEDKLMEFAPTVFSEKKEEEEEEEGDEDTSSRDDDDDDDDDEEEEDDTEDMKEGFGDFASHLTDVVAYLEQESGTTLSEEQISEVAHMILNEKLDEVGEEDDDVDNDGDEDESDDYLKNRRKKIGKRIKDEDEDEDDKLDEALRSTVDREGNHTPGLIRSVIGALGGKRISPKQSVLSAQRKEQHGIETREQGNAANRERAEGDRKYREKSDKADSQASDRRIAGESAKAAKESQADLERRNSRIKKYGTTQGLEAADHSDLYNK